MTISTETNSARYDGDGATTVFPVPFYFLEDEHLIVTIAVLATGAETEQVLNVDYTVDGANDPNGGSITMATAPAVGQKLVILRDVPATQPTDYVENDDLRAETLERGFDRLTMLVQQLFENVTRSLKLPSFSTLTDVVFPVPEAGKVVVGNETADGWVNKNIEQTGGVVYPISVINGGTGATTGPQGLLNLGFTSPDFQIFQSSGTFEKAGLPEHVTDVIVWVLGAGAGGGGANTSTNFRGVGGGSGGFALKRIAVSALAASEIVTIGAPGDGGISSSSPEAGGDGGVTSFGAHASANGGAAGLAATGSAIGGVPGGTAVGDLTLVGGTSATMSNNGGANSEEVSHGGDAPMGLGQGGRNATEAGKGYGAGGAPGSHAGANGGVGAPGLVIVWW